MKKKILSILLTFAMILSMTAMFAVTVSAAGDITDGTIDNYEDLKAFIESLATNDYAGTTIKLTVDITVNEGWVANDGTNAAVTAPTGENAKTLNTAAATTAFAGTFDGQGNTISGLYMTGKGFFPKINGAEIKNVTFDNCGSNVTEGGSWGIVAGEQTGNGLTFKNVVVKNSKIVNNVGSVNLGVLVGKITTATSPSFTECKTINCNLYTTKATSYVGGIVGYNTKAVNFERCSSDTNIDATSDSESDKFRAGGMIGYSATSEVLIKECVNTGDITAQAYAGGMVGDTAKKITIIDCVNQGAITVSQIGAKDGAAGGMIGRLNNAYGTSIKGSVNYGEVVAVKDGDMTNITAGGMIGFIQNKTDSNQEQIPIQESANYGAVSSAVYAGGVLAYLAYGELTVTGFVNKGNVNADSYSSSILGYGANHSTHKTKVEVKNCVNDGAIVAGIDAGGVVGLLNSGGSNTTTIVNSFVNTGSITANKNAGGLFAEMSYDLNVSNIVNTGDITAANKAGGLIGIFSGVSGTINKAITVGTIKGYSNTKKTVDELISAETAINTGASCAAFGQWNQDVVEGKEVEFIDFFYNNNGVKNVFGLWANLGTVRNAHKVYYTATEKSLTDFKPGTTNTDLSKWDDTKEEGKEYDGTQGANLAIYNNFFVENGYMDDPSDFYAEKGASIFKAFNLGVDWMLTATVPVPASAFALMEDKELVEANIDYVGFQRNAGTTLTSIRMIAGLDSLKFQNTGFELYLVPKGEEGEYVDLNSKVVYTALNVYDAEGNARNPYLASTAGYEYLSAITLTGLNTLSAGTTTVIVRPYVSSTVKEYGSACAIVFEKTGDVVSIVNQYVM